MMHAEKLQIKIVQYTAFMKYKWVGGFVKLQDFIWIVRINR